MATAITPVQYAVASGITSGITAIGSAYAQYASYQIQEIQTDSQNRIAAMQYEMDAKQAEVSVQRTELAAYQSSIQGKYDVLQMQQSLNKTLASNAVMSAAQNRTGGSAAAISSAATAEFNWDKDFTELSSSITQGDYNQEIIQGKLNVSGNRSQADMSRVAYNPYGGAASMSLIGGITGAVGKASTNIGEKLYKIGGSTTTSKTGDID